MIWKEHRKSEHCKGPRAVYPAAPCHRRPQRSTQTSVKYPCSLEGPASDVLCKRSEFEVVCVFKKLEWLLGVKGNPPLSLRLTRSTFQSEFHFLLLGVSFVYILKPSYTKWHTGLFVLLVLEAQGLGVSVSTALPAGREEEGQCCVVRGRACAVCLFVCLGSVR